jgi:putative ABC transport system permease protein
MGELWTRFLDLFRRGRFDAELKAELAFHEQMLERDARATGLGAEDAAHAARRELGNITGVRERSRDAWTFAWLDVLGQDVRYTFRGLRRAPGFTAAVIITLGLGIGANAAMFGVIDRLMFRPFPYLREPSTVQRLYLQGTYSGRTLIQTAIPFARYLDFAKWTTSFSEFAAFDPEVLAIGVGDAAAEQPMAAVSASYFGFFDARPALGRFFGTAEDTIPAGANVTVLSYAFWQSHFGGRNVIGEPLEVGSMSCTIIGVAPAGFTGVSEGPAPVLFVPITTFGGNLGGGSNRDFYWKYNWDWANVMVRRKPGVSIAAASIDVTNAYLRSRIAARAIHPDFAQVERIAPHAIVGSLKTAAGPDAGLEARTLLAVTGVAAIVLLIACANVANLFLARALRRRREMALRIALGVSRRRLLAQALTESLVLALLGCAAGIAVAQWGGATLAKLFVPNAGAFDLRSDWRTLGVAVAAALFAGIVTGLAPMLLGDDDLSKTLKAGVREGTHARSGMRSALLVAQGALSVVLLVGAGLFVRSLDRVRTMRLGYDVSHVLQVEWNWRGVRVIDTGQVPIRARLLAAATALPGVESAGWVSAVPFQGTNTQSLYVDGIDTVSKLGRFDSQTADAGYFATMGTRILRGRAITSADRAGAPHVVVLSESMAKTIWPGKDALGECIRIGIWRAPRESLDCSTVVGIAEDAVHNPLTDEPNRYYIPIDQFLDFGASRLLLRMRGTPASAAEEVRRALQREMAGQQYVTVRPLSELVDDQRRSWSIGATMFAGFGLLALVVASVGLYGVISYNVVQRMHELGVRVALGAQPANILELIVGQGVRFALAGVAAGVALALAASHWFQPLLFRESAKDPVVYALVGAALLLVAVIASTSPALRAAKADPNAALRSD